MAFITLINNRGLTCATDQMVLTPAQVESIENIANLQRTFSRIRDIELKLIENAKAEGYEKGYQEGLSASVKDVKLLFTEFLDSTIESMIETHTLTQKSILELALNVTRKIAEEIGPETVITGIAHRAINQLKAEKPIEIKVHAELADTVKQKLESRRPRHDANTPLVEVIPDPSMGQFDCVITSDLGVTEASFEQQLKSLDHQLGRAIQKPDLSA